MQNYFLLVRQCCQIVLKIGNSPTLSKEQANNGSIWVCEAEYAPSQHDEEKYRLCVLVGGGMLLQVRGKDSEIPVLHFSSSRLHTLNLLISPVAEWTDT